MAPVGHQRAEQPAYEVKRRPPLHWSLVCYPKGMRIAIISAGSNEWAAASSLLLELTQTLASVSEVDASIWLVGDRALKPDISWSESAPQQGRIHLLELQGRQASARSLTSALGYLVCERDEQFDGFVLLDGAHTRDAHLVGAIIENSFLHPGAVIFGKVNLSALSPRRRTARRWSHFLTRALCGERFENSTLTFLPSHAAEALAHSCHAGSHVEAAVHRLGLPSVCTSAVRGSARPASSLEMLEGLCVFRERVFARTFAASSLLCAFSVLLVVVLSAFHFTSPGRISLGALALVWILPLVLGLFAGAALLMGLATQALNESRRWTPALDSALLLRSVIRVKRGPQAIAN
jgi:hypothetical protein